MSQRSDILQVSYRSRYYFTISWYKEPHWGKLHLGDGRNSYNFGKFSFIFERY